MAARDTRWSEMDHVRIDENQVADRYLMGQLDESERRSFEEHFVDCGVCLEKLEAIEGLRAALKELPAVVSATSTSTAAAGSRDRFARPFVRPLVTFLLAASLLVASAASLVFHGEANRARRDLEADRQVSATAKQREAELEAVLEKERAIKPHAFGDTAMGALRAAPLAATVYTLNLTRSDPSDTGDRISLPEAPGWLVLLFDRPDGPAGREYRVRLSTSGGVPVGGVLTAGAASSGMLAVSLPSSLLAAGGYRLSVEDARSNEPLVTYRFRAVGKR